MDNSKKTQAELNNRQWIADYRKRMAEVPAQVSPVDISQLVELLSNQGTAGMGAATGLAGAQALLGGWLAGANAKSRKAESDLANERWLKQNEDEAEERAYNRKQAEEDRKVFLPSEETNLSPFSGVNPDEQQKQLFGAHVAANPIEAARLSNQRQMERVKLADMEATSKPTITGKALDTKTVRGVSGIGNRITSGVKSWFSDKGAAAKNAERGIREEGFDEAGSVDPSFFRKRAQKELQSKNLKLAVQYSKIASFIDSLGKNVVVMSNYDGDVISIGTPKGNVIITPENVDKVMSRFDARVAK